MLQSLLHLTMIILQQPLTFHDLITYAASTQCTFMDLWAFLDYVTIAKHHIAYPSFITEPLHVDWMGCFTTSHHHCNQLFHAGIPIWLIRPASSVS